MTPIELKQWQSDLDLSELAMAAYIGVPVHTLRGWIKGTRKPDAAPLRLMHLLQMIETRAPVHPRPEGAAGQRRPHQLTRSSQATRQRPRRYPRCPSG